jgi:hypothetical protein
MILYDMLFIYRKCVCVSCSEHYPWLQLRMYDVVGSSIGNGRTIQAGLDQTLFFLIKPSSCVFPPNNDKLTNTMGVKHHSNGCLECLGNSLLGFCSFLLIWLEHQSIPSQSRVPSLRGCEALFHPFLATFLLVKHPRVSTVMPRVIPVMFVLN